MNYILHFSPMRLLETAFFFLEKLPLRNSGRSESGQSGGKVDGHNRLNVLGPGKYMGGRRNKNRQFLNGPNKG